MNKKVATVCLALLVGSIAAEGQSPDEARLVALRALKIDAGSITLVQHDAAPALPGADARAPKNVPPRTIVKIVLQPAKGSNINVEIWLPDAAKWNGRLLGLGNGGSAGRISPNTLAGPMSTGYAAATTDLGTAPNADSGVGNPEVWRDFGYRATHLMTVAAKQVVASFYGKAPEYSYFSGGSTGGQQALQEAQRYPDDYDGITAAVPAHCRTPLHAYFLWNDQVLTKCPFSKSQSDNVIAAGNEYMAAREIPPIAGKFVSDPRCNSKDIEAVVALALKKDSTLTPAHTAALRKLFDGPRHAVTGERIFNGIPIGSSLEAAHGHLYLFKWVFGAEKKMEDINFGADIDTYTAALAPYLNAENADLSAFEKRGGKLIITSGSADSVVPYHATLDYYERVIERFGSLEKAKSFCQLYIVPGLAHGGGPGVQPPSLLEYVRTWREKGTAPTMLTGRRVVDGKTELEMPLYPYPTKTGWDAATSTFKPVDGPRGGVERVAERFRPPAAN
jgi:feruloyl esterase